MASRDLSPLHLMMSWRQLDARTSAVPMVTYHQNNLWKQRRGLFFFSLPYGVKGFCLLDKYPTERYLNIRSFQQKNYISPLSILLIQIFWLHWNLPNHKGTSMFFMNIIWILKLTFDNSALFYYTFGSLSLWFLFIDFVFSEKC